MTEFKTYHPIVFTEFSEIKTAIAIINNEINGRGFYFQWDQVKTSGCLSYRAAEVPAEAIIIIASFDFSYYHQLEMVFYDVQAHTFWPEGTWPDHWTKDQLEMDEQMTVDGFFRFLFNRGSHGDHQHAVYAKGFSYRFVTVLYHNKVSAATLNKDTKIAWWVR